MPCYRPLEAWRTLENTSKGKKGISFQKSAITTHKINLPCGQCIGCRLERSLSWAIRCVNEAQMYEDNAFITLTYNQKSLPWDGSLHKSHFQQFIKRLRKNTQQKIRYFMCGEYGENLSRPHYHACLFGIDFPDKEIYRQEEGILTYQSEMLESTWGKGFATTGELNFDTAAYTARYITKKVTGDKAQDHYQSTCQHTGNLIQLEPEYCTMSLKPGIGAVWLDKYLSDAYPSDYLIHKAKKIKLPRYYDNIYENLGEDLEEIKIQRKKKARKHLKENTPERLATREQCKILKHKQLTRSYENQ